MKSILFLIETIYGNKIHTHLSQLKTVSSDFFAEFLQTTLNLEHVEKKDDPHSWCIPEITDSEKGG